MKLGFSKKQYFGILGVSAIALLALQPANTVGKVAGFVAGPAHAEGHDESSDDHGGGKGGKGGTGGSGGSDDHSHDDSTSDDHDHEDGTEDDHDHTDGGSGKGPKGGGGHADGQAGSGQGAGQGGKGSAGNRPVWASEGIPEVELGRLNVVRSPSHVLDRAYVESLSEFTTGMVEFYSLPMSDALNELRTKFRDIEFIDSPLQNLALFRNALEGESILITDGGVTNTNKNLMAMFLGTASDKSIPITPETAYSVSLILGYQLSQAAATSLAADAEKVRQAVLEGHG